MTPSPFPNSVNVFSPADSADTINQIVNEAYTQNGGSCGNGEFHENRYAFLFKPGSYPGVRVPVGYYTSVMGLGRTPSETTIPNVYCPQVCGSPGPGALDTFWRSAENFNTTPTRSGGFMEWAVSQACPLRRIQAPGIKLSSDGYSSGGFMADCNVSGTVISGTQQQWMSRNCDMNWDSGGMGINMVFVGCIGAIPSTTSCSGSHCPATFTNFSSSPVIAEKPYIVFENNQYSLLIPPIEFGKTGSTTDFTTGVISVPIPPPNAPGGVFVVQDHTKITAADINGYIQKGIHIILTPGIYNFEGPIRVSRSNVTILGIGFPTLIASGTEPCIVVDDNLTGVRIGGILLQAGASVHAPSTSLLRWGTVNTSTGYNFLYDCFARVGGPIRLPLEQVSATLMVQINSSRVICDNLWLWRADHDVNGPVFNEENPCDTGFQVNGDDVIVYGLAVEHTLKDLTQWYGNRGQCFFYQSEFPYDVPKSWEGPPAYTGYRAEPKSTDSFYAHNAYGVGVYCYFRDHAVIAANGVSTTENIAVESFINTCTVRLNGTNKGGSGITSVINKCGNNVISVDKFMISRVAKFPPCPQIET